MLFIYNSSGYNFKINNKMTNTFSDMRYYDWKHYGILSIMAYYYGFLFTIIVNSIMWYVISYLVSKYYYKSKGINDQKYLIQYGLSKIKSRKKN